MAEYIAHLTWPQAVFLMNATCVVGVLVLVGMVCLAFTIFSHGEDRYIRKMVELYVQEYLQEKEKANKKGDI